MDLVEAVAHPLPVTVICELLGVPREDEPKFAGWSDALARSLDGRGLPPEELERIGAERDAMLAYMAALVGERRASPGEDYLSLLIAAEQDGERLSVHEIFATLALLLVAGHETTVNLIANAMLALLRDPALLARVQSEPALVPKVVEETLRHDTPVHWRMRTCSEDLGIAGETIPRGATIALMLAAANRDPERYPEPDRFDPDRDTHGHLGFGGGSHYCAGAGLARLEAQIAVGELVRRLRDPQMANDPPYRRNAALRGPERLDVAISGITS